MENTLTAAELKRRGMAAIQSGLKRGPIQLLKHNRPTAVVLSQAQYRRLLGAAADDVLPGMTAMEWLLAHASRGAHSKQEIDERLDDERSWQ